MSISMKCPFCGYQESKVIDSRPAEESNSIRRRRECVACASRFTTYESVETVKPFVLKKDGSKEYFDREKLLSGLMRACQKRPVDAAAIADDIEYEIHNSLCREITSKEIGEMAMDRLRGKDAVAYVRFASVHREFKDVETFMKELKELQTEDK